VEVTGPRRVALRVGAGLPIAQVMSRPVDTVAAEARLYSAIALMRQMGRRHLPVLDAAGRAIGLLRLDAALAAAAPGMLERVRQIHAADRAGATQRRRAIAELSAEVMRDGAGVADVQALIAALNNDRYAATARTLLAEHGPPLVGFALLVMGSGGRGESLLGADQDNGLILADYPDAAHDRVDGWFRGFAEVLNQRMSEHGIELCRGGVMAHHPLWRKSLSQWCHQLDLWLAKRSPAALLNADIFFDFQCVFGDAGLAAALRDHVTRRLRGNCSFLGALARREEEYDVALGFFGRLVMRDSASDRCGAVDLKLGGLGRLVDAVRLLALMHGIAETPTRLAELKVRGKLAEAEFDDIASALDVLATVLLQQQRRDIAAGREPGNLVPASNLRSRVRERLTVALQIVRRFRRRVHADLTGNLF